DVAVGNVLGSNIFNVLFILGLTALLCPVSMSKENRERDIPETLLVTILFGGFGMSHSLFGISEADGLSRVEGAIFLVAFALYIFASFHRGKSSGEDSAESTPRKLWIAIILVLAGLAGLIFGGNLFVDSATDLARMLGVSDKFIAVTILAGGTSLPELATSLVAALKGRDQLALGNILGSNVFNILLILGSSALITPLSFASVTLIDAAVLLLSVILLLLWAYTGRRERIDRWEGGIMLLLFGAYYYYLFINL
ncbi:MAG: sodium:calcium antiporter, partial [Bacteroidales bacterium]|nr:sodium:calcium antiporter [Bacteroidales bacterium]